MASHRADASPPESWGIRPGLRVWVGGNDRIARREVERLLAGTVRLRAGPIDAAFVCPASVDEALYFVAKVRPRIERCGAVWIVHVGEANGSGNDQGPPADAMQLACRTAGLDGFARVSLGDTCVSAGFRRRAE